MRHATIVSGKYENAWDDEAAKHVINEEGEVNWRAAFTADPGIKICPQCKSHYWDEAAVMKCLDCGRQFGEGVPT